MGIIPACRAMARAVSQSSSRLSSATILSAQRLTLFMALANIIPQLESGILVGTMGPLKHTSGNDSECESSCNQNRSQTTEV